MSASEVVTLRGGPAVPVAAVELLLDFERRGFDVRVDTADGAVVVHPGGRLSETDEQAITAHKDALRALVAYCAAIQ